MQVCLPAVLLRSTVLHNDILVVHQAHALHEVVAELRPVDVYKRQVYR